MELNPVDELKIVQDIIAAQEQLYFRVYGWAVGIITAFTIALFHKGVHIPSLVYIIFGLVTVCGFFIVARHHWHTFTSAVKRSRQIEDEINDGTYAKIKFNHVLKTNLDVGIFGEYKLWVPYTVLAFFIVGAGLFRG